MLWDIIRDFFVMYIFGGFDSNGNNWGGVIGNVFEPTNLNYDYEFSNSFYLKIGDFFGDNLGVTGVAYLSVGDWLSTTFTVITLILICYVFLRLTIWLFKFGAGLFKW